jgi:predicted Na+-dependent transporter
LTLCCASVFTGLAAILLHFAFLFFNILATWLLRFPEKERKAIIVMASQKNLPTAAGRFSWTQQRSSTIACHAAG